MCYVHIYRDRDAIQSFSNGAKAVTWRIKMERGSISAWDFRRVLMQFLPFQRPRRTKVDELVECSSYSFSLLYFIHLQEEQQYSSRRSTSVNISLQRYITFTSNSEWKRCQVNFLGLTSFIRFRTLSLSHYCFPPSFFTTVLIPRYHA